MQVNKTPIKSPYEVELWHFNEKQKFEKCVENEQGEMISCELCKKEGRQEDSSRRVV